VFEHQVMKVYKGMEVKAPCILNLDRRWRLVVKFMLQLLYPHGWGPKYPLNRMDGPQSQSRCSGEKKPVHAVNETSVV